jgi:hypothetical protein
MHCTIGKKQVDTGGIFCFSHRHRNTGKDNNEYGTDDGSQKKGERKSERDATAIKKKVECK